MITADKSKQTPTQKMATQHTGGGIDTRNLSSAVVTHVTGADAKPVREEDLRNRFLTFDPIFDREGHVVARELVLRGVILAANLPVEIQRMNEDMLLTGLYSLIQDNLIGEQPLLIQISRDVLFSDALPQLNRPGVIWVLRSPDSKSANQAQSLAKSAAMQFCLDGQAETTQENWAFQRFDTSTTPFRLNKYETEPGSAMLPPLRVTATLTSEAARFRLSDKHSIISATPPAA